MKRLLLLIIIGTLMLSSMTSFDVAAQSTTTNGVLLDQMSTTIIVHDNGSVSIIIDVRVDNIGIGPVTSADIRVDSLDVTVTSVVSNSGDTEFILTTMERHTMITIPFRNALNTNASEWIHLELQSHDLLSDLEQDETVGSIHGGLVYYFRPHNPVTNFTFVVMLPAHAFLSHKSSVPLFPEADTNFTDGERIAFKWLISAIQPGQERAFIVRYQGSHISNNFVGVSSIVLGFVGLVGIFIGLGLATLGPKVITRIRQFGEVQVAGITREETIILETLQMRNGSCSQQELYQELDISESKLSLILNGLEEKGLVKRFRKGRKNIVHRLEG